MLSVLAGTRHMMLQASHHPNWWFQLVFCQTNITRRVIRPWILDMGRDNKYPTVSIPWNVVTVKCCKSWDRAAEVKANRIVNLRLNVLKGSFSIGSKADKCLRTGPTDQVEQDLGVVGFNWKIPFMNRDTTGRLPSCCPTTGSCTWEIQALYTPSVCKLNWVSWIVQLRKLTHHLQVLKRDIYSVEGTN